MLILEENNKKFNEKVDSITVFIRKVFKLFTVLLFFSKAFEFNLAMKS